MSLQLLSFPTEVLSEITSHLHGFIVLRLLHMTGSRGLWDKLQAGGITDVWLNSEMSKNSDVSKLASFKGLQSVTAKWTQVGADDLQHLLSILPPNLTKLHLEQNNSEVAMVRDFSTEELRDPRNRHFHASGRTPWNLSERFPRLRYLHLEGRGCLLGSNQIGEVWSDGMFLLFLRMLPRSLEYLFLSQLVDCQLEWRRYLPPHLTHLGRPLDPLSVSMRLQAQAVQAEMYPATLQQSLRSCSLGIEMPPSIPPHLTSLECSVALVVTSVLQLPTTLTSLTIAQPIGLATRTDSLSNEVIDQLPRSLTRIHIDKLTNITSLAVWPPLLVDLKFWPAPHCNGFENLPKGLTALDLDMFSAPSISILSTIPAQSLRRLSFSRLPIASGSDVRQLPRQLETLEANLLCLPDFIAADAWPPNLHTLRISGGMGFGPNVSESFLRSLPPSVTKVDLDGAMSADLTAYLPSTVLRFSAKRFTVADHHSHVFLKPENPDTLELPQSLYFLPLHSQSRQVDLPLTPTLPFHLRSPLADGRAAIPTMNRATPAYIIPPSVTSLRLFSPPKHVISLLGSLSNLTRLEIINSDISLKHTALPPQLTDLSLPLKQTWAGALPTTLRHLKLGEALDAVYQSLTQLESLTVRINDPHQFALLPASLTDLRLIYDRDPGLGKLKSEYESLEVLSDYLHAILGSDVFDQRPALLPNLTRLEGNFELNQTLLARLARSGRKLHLGSIGILTLASPHEILRFELLATLNTTSMSELLHQAVHEYYPYLHGLKVGQIVVHLNLSIWERYIASHLPSTLTSLSLRDFNWPGKFGKAKFPATIIELDLFGMIGTPSDVSFLPPHLTSLAVSAQEFGVKSYADLPRSITKLQLQDQPKFLSTHAAALPPNLLHLTLDAMKTAASAIAALPRSLTELEFGKRARDLQDDAMLHLPPHLVYLGGFLQNVSKPRYIETLSQLPSFNTHMRLPDAEIRNHGFSKALTNSSLEQLAEHLTLLHQ